MVVFPATAAFPISVVTLIKINYPQNLRFIEGICLSSTVMYRFWIKLEKAKINNYIRCTLAQKTKFTCALKSLFSWDALLSVCSEHLFEQLLKIYLNNIWVKKSNVPYAEISQNFCDDLFSSIKQFTLGDRIIF